MKNNFLEFMHKFLDDYLCKKYPKIFAERNLPPQQSCMHWGIETGDGWFFLINGLCSCIQNYIDNNNDLINVSETNSVPIPQVVSLQIKEKFAGLRFYYKGGNDIVKGMVYLAEALSYRICEECGVMNELVINNTNGWVQTTCPCCTRPNNKDSHIANRNIELIQLWENVQEDKMKEKLNDDRK